MPDFSFKEKENKLLKVKSLAGSIEVLRKSLRAKRFLFRLSLTTLAFWPESQVTPVLTKLSIFTHVTYGLTILNAFETVGITRLNPRAKVVILNTDSRLR